MSDRALLRIDGLTKRFGPVVALDDVSLDIEPGEIHAVLGENGAGKTTLMNVLYGLARPDAGTLRWRGVEVRLRSSAEALALGVGMVHQHFMLVPALTVWENVWLAHPDRPRFRLRRARARAATEDLSRRFRLDLPVDARVDDLPVGTRQRVEIAKALSRPVSLLILDEPTAVLAPAEVRELFVVVRALREAGTTVLFISHKLAEVRAISDRVTVLRRGRVTARGVTAQLGAEELARSIVGVDAGEPVRPRATGVRSAAPRLAASGLGSSTGRVPVRDVSFELHGGEILGVTGVDGNGQDELVALLAGIGRPTAGTVRLDDRDVTTAGPADRARLGLAVLPGDRAREGLVLDATIGENLALREFGATWARRGPLRTVDPAAHDRRARELLERFDVRASGPGAAAATLSGGNQQKLLVARELAAEPSVLVFHNPTRGLDLTATRELHRTLVGLRDEGRAVLFFTTDLDEVLALADRCAVMTDGRLVEVDRKDRDRIGALMLGTEAAR